MKLNIKSEAAAGIVAGASFIASAGHIVHVVSATNPIGFALVYPVGIDGLLYVGIRAVQTGRRVAGIFAILIGAIYSLAFNAHAEGALTMPKLMIASSMPVCMVVAFVIEGTAKKAADIEPAPQVITKTVAPALLPIVPFAPKPVAAPTVVPVASRHGGTNFVKVDAPKVETKKDEKRTDAPKATGGRVASWDVEKAVRLLADGRTDVEILSLVDGLTAKPWQRTKRAAKLIASGGTDAEIATTCGVSVAHVARIRKA